jgi:3-hydroxyisobutyrate dehydrogenase/2-hydroxy-3-oxopropionate reductase
MDRAGEGVAPMGSGEQAQVAVVGVGRMGSAMVRRLRKEGYPVVVFNRNRHRAEAVADATGAVVADTAREATQRTRIVVVSVVDDAALSAVHDGPDGIGAGLDSGGVVIQTSTVAPATVQQLASRVQERGAQLLDAPVSGGVQAAELGELLFLIGGEETVVDAARLVLYALASRVFHLGAVGTGAAMKLAVNTVLAALNQGLCEALPMAEASGIDRMSAYDVFAASAVGAPFVQYKRRAFLRPRDRRAEFSIALLAKDLTLASDVATGSHLRVDQLEADRRLLADAIHNGYGDRDISAVAELLRTSR